jgi:guanylate kinase
MNNQRFELSSSIFICPESWDDVRQHVVGRSEEAKIMNNRLNKMATGYRMFIANWNQKENLFLP